MNAGKRQDSVSSDLSSGLEGIEAEGTSRRRDRMRTIGAAVGIVIIVALMFDGIALAAGDAAKGRATFQKFCSGCHGEAGKGDGAMGAALNPKPKDLSDKAYNGSLKNDYLIKLIKGGGQAVGKSPMMPNVGSLKDGEVADVIAYIRSLAK